MLEEVKLALDKAAGLISACEVTPANAVAYGRLYAMIMGAYAYADDVLTGHAP